MKKTLLSGLTLIAAMQLHAQQNNINGAMDSVIVKENRIQLPLSQQNRNIQILDQKQIQALPVKSTAELLSYAAGIDLRQRGVSGTQADISIDGSTFDQVLVLINGVKMSDPQTGHHILNLPIPLSSIQQIEILRGPAARTYGVNALAGAINIITRTPTQNEVSGQVYAGSSFMQDTATGETYFGWGAQAAATVAAKKQSHTLSLAHDEGNGYRHNTAFNAYRFMYQNRFELNAKNMIDATAGYIYNTFGANGYYSAPKDAESEETVQTFTANVKYTYKPTEALTITPRISYRYNNDDYIFVKQKPALYHNTHETNVTTGEVQGSLKMKNGIAGFGVELRNEAIQSTNLGSRQRNNFGLFAEYKHNFSTNFNAGAGVFVNYNTDYDWQVFPGVDAGYRISRNWKVFANATMGQRLPTYTDLYYVGPTNVGNPALKPEMAAYAEGGIQYLTVYGFLQGSYFYKNVSDFIDWVRPNDTAAWQPRNFQSIITQGITLQANYDWTSRLNISDKFRSTINASYTYLNPSIEAPMGETSKYAIDALKHQVVISARNMLLGNISVNITGRYLYRISANDYTVLDARVGYQLKKWMIYADVNNILDTRYKEIGTIPMPGRWITAGARFNSAIGK